MKLHHKNFKYIEFKPQKWNSEKKFLPFYWQRNINCRTDCDFNAEDLFGRKLQWNSLWETKIHWSQNKTLTETNKRSRNNPTRLFWIFQPNEMEFTMTFIVSRRWSGSLNLMERAVCLEIVQRQENMWIWLRTDYPQTFLINFNAAEHSRGVHLTQSIH